MKSTKTTIMDGVVMQTKKARKDRSKTFLIRKNCEYSIEVEAVSEEDALAIVEGIPDEDWGQAWSGLEVED